MVAAIMVVVGVRPEVKGASCTGVAPAKAGDWEAAVGLGMESAAMGLRTLSWGEGHDC